MQKLNILESLVLDEIGRVILPDEILEQINRDTRSVVSGGMMPNTISCGNSGNISCTNSGSCSQTTNGTCSNSIACSGSSNSTCK